MHTVGSIRPTSLVLFGKGEEVCIGIDVQWRIQIETTGGSLTSSSITISAQKAEGSMFLFSRSRIFDDLPSAPLSLGLIDVEEQTKYCKFGDVFITKKKELPNYTRTNAYYVEFIADELEVIEEDATIERFK